MLNEQYERKRKLTKNMGCCLGMGFLVETTNIPEMLNIRFQTQEMEPKFMLRYITVLLNKRMVRKNLINGSNYIHCASKTRLFSTQAGEKFNYRFLTFKILRQKDN